MMYTGYMKKPRLLVACEYSGVVREAFNTMGWDAWSCDLRETEQPGQHITGDVIPLLQEHWDLLIAHPPCTIMANSGARWLYEEWTIPEKQAARKQGKELAGHSPRRDEQRWAALKEATDFFNLFTQTNIKHVAVENPKMHGHARKLVGGGPTQYVQPYHFGTMESKETGLRLINLPPLVPTNDVETEMRKLPRKVWNRMHYMSPGPNRERERSRTYPAIAQAMAEQWTPYILERL